MPHIREMTSSYEMVEAESGSHVPNTRAKSRMSFYLSQSQSL